ncbi:Lrp/AsnC family transcriptional regulator [Streptomyces sparsogenes]|uniref:Lrp/AsnC family transcriptional regulator n=1 Tax=Streptomyces sparsogenes TaxID=67365 RepID=UPI00384BCD70
MNTDPVMLDDIDRGLVHALQIDGRAPLRTLGEVLGVSENTVARRYRRLRSAGVLRVVGAFSGARLGYRAWTIRLRCTPDAAGPLARALAARPDTSYVHLLSGGTEISCSAQTRSGEESDALLLHRLPRTGRITSVSAHLLLDHSALPSGWAGPALLSGEQTAALGPPPVDGTEDVTLEEGDRALFDALSRDGRASHAELAAATRGVRLHRPAPAARAAPGRGAHGQAGRGAAADPTTPCQGVWRDGFLRRLASLQD